MRASNRGLWRAAHCCFGSDADLIVQCVASTGQDVSVCLNLNKKDYLLSIPKLVASVLSKPLPSMGAPALAAARYDFALLSLFMGNDYLPSVKNGHLNRLWPHYVKVRGGAAVGRGHSYTRPAVDERRPCRCTQVKSKPVYRERSLVRWRAGDRDGRHGDSLPAVLDWELFLEVMVLCNSQVPPPRHKYADRNYELTEIYIRF
jgi:hypothetical protein